MSNKKSRTYDTFEISLRARTDPLLRGPLLLYVLKQSNQSLLTPLKVALLIYDHSQKQRGNRCVEMISRFIHFSSSV